MQDILNKSGSAVKMHMITELLVHPPQQRPLSGAVYVCMIALLEKLLCRLSGYAAEGAP